MEEFYVIRNTVTDLYYHSLIPRGRPLWCDNKEDAQYILRKEAYDIMGMISRTLDENSIIFKVERA